MTDRDLATDPLHELAESLLERVRRGERPTSEEYAARHPDRADEVRDLIAAVVALEEIGPGTEPAAPRRLGEFRIIREIARGGMGVVYEAVQVSLGRRVALKVLPPGRGSTFRERFRREAQAVASLHHTNIVPVFGVGEAAGTLFYAMQYIDGVTLADVATRGRDAATGVYEGSDGFTAPLVDSSRGVAPIDATSAARWMAQAADALAHAHAHGILHRDIKPGNLLLDTEGTLWVADFGLSKAADADDLTGTGDLVGTLRYMAPERFRGDADARSDVYALGVTLYQLLTGRLPFDFTDRLALIDQIAAGQPPRPRQIAPHVPRDLETVVLKAMARDPADRYAGAADLADDLRRFLADRPVLARRHTWAGHAWRWARRNPTVAALTGSVAGLVLAVAVISGVSSLRLGAALERTASAERDGRHKLFEAYLSQAEANLESRRSGQRFVSLARLADAAKLARELDLSPEKFAELRRVAVNALTCADLLLEDTPVVVGEGVANLSDDLTLYANSDLSGTCTVGRVADGFVLARLPIGPDRAIPFFSPDGSRLVTFRSMGDRSAQLWALDDPRSLPLPDEKRPVYWLHFRPDGRRLALAYTDGSIGVYDPTDGRQLHWLAPAVAAGETHAALHPTEPLVAVCSYKNHGVFLRDLTDGRTVATLRPPWAGGSVMTAWSPDGRILAVPSGDTALTALYPFDPSAQRFGEPRTFTDWHGGTTVAFNPAGDRLASTGWNSIVTLTDVPTGQILFRTPSAIGPMVPHFDATGRRLIGPRLGTRGDRLRTIAVADAREYRTIPFAKANNQGYRPAVDPSGRLAVAAENDGLSWLDLNTGRRVAFLPGPGTIPSFGQDGALYTTSTVGTFRWPVRRTGGQFTVGPPEPLPLPAATTPLDASHDGRAVVLAADASGMVVRPGGWLLDADRPGEARCLVRPDRFSSVRVSPDGRWVVIDGLGGKARVFDTRSGAMAWQSPTASWGSRFTPDGRWLVVPGADSRLYAVGTWAPGRQLGSGGLCDFSLDGRRAVLTRSEGGLRLTAADGRELVRLDDLNRAAKVDATSDGPKLVAAAFTPDGTKLVAATGSNLRVWELPAIRRQLAAIDLDWAEPPDPPVAAADTDALEVTILSGNVLADATAARNYELGLAALRLTADPFDVAANLTLGRRLSSDGQFAAAHTHFGLALLARPDSRDAYAGRGWAANRLGRPADAVADLSAALRLNPVDERPRSLRASLLLDLGRPAEAEADLTALIARMPNDADLYERRAACRAAAGDTAGSDADRRSAAEHEPASASGLNNRAWRLVTGAPAERDVPRGLALARKAVAVGGGDPLHLNTLGVALYRAGQPREAVPVLERSLTEGRGRSDAFDLYFLALSHHALGDAPKARDYFERAVRWRKTANVRPNEVQELDAFHAEVVASFAAPSPR